jgi:hypothetical protein
MNSDVIPAAIAAAGGTALGASILAHERRRDRSMRAGRVRLVLRFPLGTTAIAAEAALAGLVGLGPDVELIAETIATVDGIAHALWVPADNVAAVSAVLQASLAGLRLTEDESAQNTTASSASLRMFVGTPTVLRTDQPDVGARAVLLAAGRLGNAEEVCIRWALRPRTPRPWSRSATGTETQQLERLWQAKIADPGFRASGLVTVVADSRSRSDALLRQIVTAYRGRYRAGHHLRLTSEHNHRPLSARPQVRSTSGWLSTKELLALIAWPSGDYVVAGVEIGASRELAASRRIPTSGRALFTARDAAGDRPVALNVEAAKHHMVVVGPTGTGKSIMLARAILADLANGHGGVVLDPKQDLIETVLAHVPPEDADRVVVLDPAADGPVPGLDLFATGDPDLRSDVVVGALGGIFHNAWGVRSDLYMRLGIRTLSAIPGATLADLGRLFGEESYRRRAIARITDPLLAGAWASFEALSPAQQAEHVQAPMARVMQLLMRPAVRAVLAQPNPQLDIGRLLAQRKFVLVAAAPGPLGEPAAKLISAIVMYATWAAIEARAALPPERRVPTFIYVDELATLASLPISVDLLAERARGLGAGLTVALQSLGRIPEHTRSALLGNVASFITFRAGASEASRIAAELPGLSATDVQSLGRFEVAARIGLGAGSEVTTVTGHTDPLGPPTGQARSIRQRSAERYGGEPTAYAEPVPDAEEADDEPRIGRTRKRS